MYNSSAKSKKQRNRIENKPDFTYIITLYIQHDFGCNSVESFIYKDFSSTYIKKLIK